MSLFSVKDLKTTKTNSKKGKGLVTAVGEALYLPVLNKKSLDEIVSEFRMGIEVHFVSDGAFSIHHLLAYLLKITGTAQVHIVTWTITELPARSLVMLKQDGLINHLSCIIDDRVKTRTPKSFQLLDENCEKLVQKKCHAKGFLIRNENWSIVVKSSMNFTKNPRIEDGSIFFTQELYDFQKSWIENILNDEL